jgi:dihydroorotate dehydrogenase (NAD+) catalytic subunit
MIQLGPLRLDTPLVAAAGTFGSIVEFAEVTSLDAYGALVAKSVSSEPWPGRPAPRVAGTDVGMLNGIGIQNPGIDSWLDTVAPGFVSLGVPVWGSAVGRTPGEFADVAGKMSLGGVAALEINLSCPNLEGHSIIALDPKSSSEVIREVRSVAKVPVGAKLSPNASNIVEIAAAVGEAGADFLTLTNTVKGAAIDIESRRPVLSGIIGGYSGPAIKPISLACVLEVHAALPEIPIVGCGGVRSGRDVVEYLLAGATAVALGTVHFVEPRAGERVLRETLDLVTRLGAHDPSELIGGMQSW